MEEGHMSDETIPSVVVVDHQQFELSDGRTFALIPPHSPELKEKVEKGYKLGKLLAWEKTIENGMRTEKFRIVDVKDIDVQTLKNLNVWDSLSSDVKTAVENKNVVEKQKVAEHMAKMQAGRKQKYPNIPREITCITCKAVQKTVPSIISKKVEKLGILLVDYINGFQCQKCHPTKGRPRKEKQ